jgi:hypothetical protein
LYQGTKCLKEETTDSYWKRQKGRNWICYSMCCSYRVYSDPRSSHVKIREQKHGHYYFERVVKYMAKILIGL